mgnify:FL=1
MKIVEVGFENERGAAWATLAVENPLNISARIRLTENNLGKYLFIRFSSENMDGLVCENMPQRLVGCEVRFLRTQAPPHIDHNRTKSFRFPARPF